MNKLELILYLQSLLLRCDNIEALCIHLAEDEVIEKADIKIREDKMRNTERAAYDHFGNEL